MTIGNCAAAAAAAATILGGEIWTCLCGILISRFTGRLSAELVDIVMLVLLDPLCKWKSEQFCFILLKRFEKLFQIIIGSRLIALGQGR
jgi:hypothetical protein